MNIEYFSRNKRLLADGDGKREFAIDNIVNLNWWHIRYGQDNQNLGDMLSEVVYEYMCKYYGIKPSATVAKTKHLYAIGSILFFENQDAVVWGTGCMHDLKKNLYNVMHQKYMRKLDVRAVRGPYTRKVLMNLGIKCPKIYGDPAMLMPLIYQSHKQIDNKVLVITHLKDKNIEAEKLSSNIVYTDMITNDWKSKVDLIASSKLIISSSLHGIVLAESYGVPAILLKPNMEGDLFKYKDYYLGTGRKQEDIPMADTIQEALEYNVNNIKVPDVAGIQKNLIESFPIDIWK